MLHETSMQTFIPTDVAFSLRAAGYLIVISMQAKYCQLSASAQTYRMFHSTSV